MLNLKKSKLNIGNIVQHKHSNTYGIIMGHPNDFNNPKLWYVKWYWQKLTNFNYIYSEDNLIKIN
jgi:heat shock protein HspQ